jgi:hypothetical protein
MTDNSTFPVGTVFSTDEKGALVESNPAAKPTELPDSLFGEPGAAIPINTTAMATERKKARVTVPGSGNRPPSAIAPLRTTDCSRLACLCSRLRQIGILGGIYTRVELRTRLVAR